MAKLNSVDKELFPIYRDQLRDENMEWAFCRKTGVTIIYKVMPKGKFIKLAVAYCNESDTFKKKIGLITAFQRWENDMAIQIPNFAQKESRTIEMFAELIMPGYISIEFVE